MIPGDERLEIAHTTVDTDGLLCTCGRYGCLQAMASGFAIAHRAVKTIKRGVKTMLPDLVNMYNRKK